MAQKSDIEFYGWLAKDRNSVKGEMVWEKYEPKKLMPTDVTIKIECCGICASDIHTISGGWGDAKWPLVTGHEIVGTIVELGSEVKDFKLGQRVGVGAQSDSCRKCESCQHNEEPYCIDGPTGTYNSFYKDGSGQSQGGYALYNRAPAHFVIPIPEGLPSTSAAPLCCGGITAYSPLADNGCGQPGVKRIGIVALGGIGHFGVIFAKAMGAEKIVVISHSDSKRELAKKLGATDFVVSTEKDWWKPHAKSLDLIVVTSNQDGMDVAPYVKMLRKGGKSVHIGIPEKPAQPTPIGALVFSGAFVGGSAIGGPKRIAEMLQLAADKKLDFMIETRPMKEANQAVVDMAAGKPRFRYVLVNE
ncbi:hypothetical protein OC846_005309 [Tilletia horrida]|uniref:Enoyl reductase (ER) domain-containing protein n=1 Tax=Tilletia horrida TaxID=155126 RepID=A0AAN6JQ15_9BASI|nr:hypothetical protein OC845_005505 [Tilletia horrida]KAK0546336.1 hypothetical protein OC846_005309 [Tilletia horrida]KAK0561858.1 hypothetical protein OC861_005610 [Tilletia horrida]